MKMPFGKKHHIKTIKVIAQGLKDAGFLENYLEIGVQKGYCFNQIAPLCRRAYAVDIDDCYRHINQNENLRWYQGSSKDFFEKIMRHLATMKFDLVFIDGDHNHEASLNDFEMVLPFVKQGGIILLHDTYPPDERFLSKSYCNDSYKTAQYIKDYYSEYEFVTLPFSYGISIFRKLNRQLLWKK